MSGVYSHENVQNQINGKIGGPPVQSYIALQDGCTGGNSALFGDVQNAVDCSCQTPGNENNSLCQAVWAGNTWNQTPFKCLIDVINNNSTCKTQLTPAARQAAFKAFSSVTGYEPMNMNQVFTDIHNQTYTIVGFTAFYVFMPVLILILVALWLMVGFGWIQWAPALYLSILSFIILYGFSILYRISAQNYLNKQLSSLKNIAHTYNDNFQSTIAYLPQGLFAVACAVSSDGQSDAWTCNNAPTCPPCPKAQFRPACRGGVCIGAENVSEDDPSDDDATRRRRRRSRKRN